MGGKEAEKVIVVGNVTVLLLTIEKPSIASIRVSEYLIEMGQLGAEDACKDTSFGIVYDFGDASFTVNVIFG